MSVLLAAAAIKKAAPLIKKGIEQVRKNKSINGNGDAPNILGEGQMINVKDMYQQKPSQKKTIQTFLSV